MTISVEELNRTTEYLLNYQGTSGLAQTLQVFIRYTDDLMDAIRNHRDQRGDDRCWQDDNMLYQVLPEGYDPPEFDEPVALENCKRYIASRQCPVTKYVPNLVEQAVHDLINRKAVHVRKGTVMEQEIWRDEQHLRLADGSYLGNSGNLRCQRI